MKKKSNEFISISISLTPEMLEFLDKRGIKLDLNRSQVVRSIIRAEQAKKLRVKQKE